LNNNPGLIVLFFAVFIVWILFVKEFDGPWWILPIIGAVLMIGILLMLRHMSNKIAEEF